MLARNVISQDQNHAANLLQQKSFLIIQAQFQKALGGHGEAVRLFSEAALLEEKIANRFRQEGKPADAATSLFSAASCYKHAGNLPKAWTLAEEALTLELPEGLSKEIQEFIAGGKQALMPAASRTLRGIVRYGAIYPFEPEALVEGELMTITAAGAT